MILCAFWSLDMKYGNMKYFGYENANKLSTTITWLSISPKSVPWKRFKRWNVVCQLNHHCKECTPLFSLPMQAFKHHIYSLKIWHFHERSIMVWWIITISRFRFSFRWNLFAYFVVLLLCRTCILSIVAFCHNTFIEWDLRHQFRG